MSVLDESTVREAMRRAWEQSQPDATDAHEEGGFVLRNDDGTFTIERWPRGMRSEIVVPEHPRGIRQSRRIVATFHTHPNVAPEFQQEPSLTDIRAVRDDADLHYPEYEGEFVIANAFLYRIRQDGTVELVGESAKLLQ